jgi:site-specific DNA-methyltransferase (adenine-specific)
MCGSGTTLKMAKLNNRNYIGIDINEEYVSLSKERLKLVIPYSTEIKNPKDQFIVSREAILEKRKNKVEKN